MKTDSSFSQAPTLASDIVLEEWLQSSGGPLVGARILEDNAVFGPFSILALIGRGGAAEVYRAALRPESGMPERIVALKVVADAAGDQGRRLLREAEVLRDHPHPGFPIFVASGEECGHAWLAVEELVPGDLPHDSAGVFRFLVPVCATLSHLHGLGFVHRDVKPSNILFRSDGSPVLIDLGLVKDTGNNPAGDRDALSVSGGRAVVYGTPGWAAPEQFSGAPVSPASDVYALGLLATECFGGKPPLFWRGVLRRATSPRPELRQKDAVAFAAGIRRARAFSRLFHTVAVPLAGLAAGFCAFWATWSFFPAIGFVRTFADKCDDGFSRVLYPPVRAPLPHLPPAPEMALSKCPRSLTGWRTSAGTNTWKTAERDGRFVLEAFAVPGTKAEVSFDARQDGFAIGGGSLHFLVEMLDSDAASSLQVSIDGARVDPLWWYVCFSDGKPEMDAEGNIIGKTLPLSIPISPGGSHRLVLEYVRAAGDGDASSPGARVSNLRLEGGKTAFTTLRDVFFGMFRKTTWDVGTKEVLFGLFDNKEARIKRFNCSPENPYYRVHDGVLFSKDGSRLVCFPLARTGEYEIPGCVRTVDHDAFGKRYRDGAKPRLTRLVLHEGLETESFYWLFPFNEANTEIVVPKELESSLTIFFKQHPRSEYAKLNIVYR